MSRAFRDHPIGIQADLESGEEAGLGETGTGKVSPVAESPGRLPISLSSHMWVLAIWAIYLTCTHLRRIMFSYG